MFSKSPEGHNEVDVDFAVYARKVKILISQMPMLRHIFQLERQFSLIFQGNFKSDRGQHDVVLTDAYAQVDIPSGETILIDPPSEFQE